MVVPFSKALREMGFPSGSMVMPFRIPLAGALTPVATSPTLSAAVPSAILFYTGPMAMIVGGAGGGAVLGSDSLWTPLYFLLFFVVGRLGFYGRCRLTYFCFANFECLYRMRACGIASFPAVLRCLCAIVVCKLLTSFVRGLPPVRRGGLTGYLRRGARLTCGQVSYVYAGLEGQFFDATSFLQAARCS